uniref:Uncharacterized protein n=1 Tax=Caenorhabditis tropicalis TaxID=1561998 RepID=A0A1I7UP47_9PELO
MKFLHNQKACGRYTYVTCDECQKSRKNALEPEGKEERDPVKEKEASDENKEEEVNPSENKEPGKEEEVTLDGNKKEVCSSEDKDSLFVMEEEESGEENEEEENTEGSSDENEDDDVKKEKRKNKKMIKKRGSEGTERYVRSAIKKMTQRIMSKPMKIIENVAEENRMLKAELAKKEEELVSEKRKNEKMEETEKRNVILTKLFNEQKEEMKQLKFLVGYFTKANEQRGQELAEIKKEVFLLKENKETVEAMEKELEEKKKKIVGLTKQLDDQKKEMNLIKL